MNIDEILEELYSWDPSMRGDEGLREVVEKLMEMRPEASADEDFKLRLKQQLLKRGRRTGFFIRNRGRIVAGATAFAAVLVLVAVFVVQPFLLRTGVNKSEAFVAEADEYAGGELETAAESAGVMAEPMMMAKEAPMLMSRSALPEAAEEYASVSEQGFRKVSSDALSTFSADVDTASYSNIRRFLNDGMLPPADAVRIEELVNYFGYSYAEPAGEAPFGVSSVVSECPWNGEHLLLQIGLQAEVPPEAELGSSNLVFLVDSSGSMAGENKLPLLKKSLLMLSRQLSESDSISIVAYAGSAGLVLPPVSAADTAAIEAAFDGLEAGGSTAGGAGIELAYKVAAENFVENGNNRVILATDGDFNIGQSSEAELTGLIERKRDAGIALTVLGLGMGNFKDARLEALADNGNGNYAYIDNIREARKVLVHQLRSTLFTVASDVKLQLEFNPAEVEAYRIIGYDNRRLADEDFDDDGKDAGEIGAGHSLTVLYEIIPAGEARELTAAAELSLRYKKPGSEQSSLMRFSLPSVSAAAAISPDDAAFAAAVVEWGLILKRSEYAGGSDIDSVIERTKKLIGSDEYGYRAEFLSLLYKTRELF